MLQSAGEFGTTWSKNKNLASISESACATNIWLHSAFYSPGVVSVLMCVMGQGLGVFVPGNMADGWTFFFSSLSCDTADTSVSPAGQAASSLSAQDVQM